MTPEPPPAQTIPPARAAPRGPHWVAAWWVWLRHDLPMILCLMLAATLVILPVLANPRTQIIGWYGDNVQFVYVTGWMSQALLLGESPFVDPRLNYPAI